MKTRIVSLSRRAGGYALLMTLAFLFVALITFGSLIHWVSTAQVITQRNNLYLSAQAAAESATENVIATMMRDFTYGSLRTNTDYAALVPNETGWPNQFAFADSNGVPNQTSVSVADASWVQLPSQFKGLYGYGHDCTIAAKATTVGKTHDVASTVSQDVWFGQIPLFQFAIFYNMEMEINPGNSMAVNGRVHSNYNIWATGASASKPLVFSSSVDATGFVTNTRSVLDPSSGRTGHAIYSDTNYPVSNADSLILPIGPDADNNPTNVASMLGLPPSNLRAPQAEAYTDNGQVYPYNEADLIISNSPAGVDGFSNTNALTVYYQNPNRANPLTPVPPDVRAVENVTSYSTNVSQTPIYNKKGKLIGWNSVTNVVPTTLTVTNYYYSFVTNQTFYDYREAKTVQAVQVDVASLNAWLNNNNPTTGGAQYNAINTSGSTDKGHGINSIYVQNEADLDIANLPAVRVTDGAQLPPDGLTVATAMPLYVLGNYNTTTDGSHYSTTLGDTTYTRPAALLGDAITVLSANWQDGWNAGTSLSTRAPVSTCINAATLEGIVPSDGSHYSGGTENFLRLLENWNNSTVLTYNGSIVVMFPSQYATAPWPGTGRVYNAPNRQWGFDTKFEDTDNLPPMTPKLKATVRGAFVTK